MLIPFQRLGLLLYPWSLRYVHDAIAAVIYNIYPFIQVLLYGRVGQVPEDKKQVSEEKKSGEKPYVISRRAIFFNVVALGAAALVVLSDITSTNDSGVTVFGYTFGLVALALSVFLILQYVPRHKQARMIVDYRYRKTNPALFAVESVIQGNTEKEKKEEEEQIIILVLDMLANIFGALLGIILLLLTQIFNIFPSFTTSLSALQIILLVFGSYFAGSLGAHFYARGVVKGKDLRVQSVQYLTPVFGVLLLTLIFPFSDYIEVILPDISLSSEIIWPWFIVGLMGIVSAITLSQLDSETGQFGLTSFVLTLWAAGAIVFFRDEWAWWSDSITSIGTASLEYYGFLGVSSTIFALLIAFEVSRLEQRTLKEQDIVFWLLSRFLKKEPENDTLPKELEKLDKSKNIATTQDSYNKIHNVLSEQEVDEETITKLNSLAFSKQSSIEVSGRITIIMLALFSITLSLSFRPSDVFSISGVLVDLFAFLISAVTAYLTFHLFDLRNARARSSIELTGKGAGYRVEFQNPTTREQTSIAISLVVLITLVYGILFAAKWL